MNNLLCRAKRLDNGEWVEGFAVPVGRDINNGEIYEWAIRQKEKREECFCLKTYLIDIATLCRCTGIEDKSGKLMFLKAIVKDDFGRIGYLDYSEHFQRLHIHFTKADRENLKNKYGVEIFDWIFPEMMLEVIGNTIDNPELLEV